MNNYKLIDSRPELTSAQVLGGMNFAAVKAGALATTTTIAGVIITKGLLTKLFISAIVISSAVMMYNKDNGTSVPEQKEIMTSNSISEPNHYGEKPFTLQETAQVTSANIKPIRIAIPTVQPNEQLTEKAIESIKEKTNEVTSNAVSTLTSPTNVMQMMTMPTVALTNPGPAVCQPGPNSIHKTAPAFNTINVLQVKDSVK
ncbi:MAG: hypothetical protein IPJ32_12365 [Sphingobacteriaceae bacterium]|nr:hypothetical protein [Sphingobacteriaceae bacterium]